MRTEPGHVACVSTFKALLVWFTGTIFVEKLIKSLGLDPQVKLIHFLWNFLLSILKDLDQAPSQFVIPPVEEAVSHPILTSSPSPPNPVHIVLYGQGEGVVDHKLYIRNIQTSGCHVSGYKKVD